MSWSGGDWMCSACQHLNFKKRDVCQICRFPKFGGPDPSTYNPTGVLAGDWYCTAMNCGAHNYASRSNCFKCGSFKNVYGGEYGNDVTYSGDCGSENFPPGWKSGDWICSRLGCGIHNYACRTECFKCKTPRNFGGAV